MKRQIIGTAPCATKLNKFTLCAYSPGLWGASPLSNLSLIWNIMIDFLMRYLRMLTFTPLLTKENYSAIFFSLLLRKSRQYTLLMVLE
ncbi:hypothetical protein BY996DRAFT_338699 [Phakopsora pachyrhizi]|nr:hypothetical protein BY996DRAFT_338699 [Phakopsora pachyrhizi]